MPRINLLPWREERRQELRKEFYILLAVTGVFAIFTLLVIHLFYVSRIDIQSNKNQFLEDEIAKLDVRIKEIKDLQKEKQQLMARVDVIERLQKNRPDVVKMMDDLVRVAPDGLYYLTVTRKDNMITIEGQAESNTRVSKLMRNIEASKMLTDPHLDVIKAKDADDKQPIKTPDANLVNYFNLTAKANTTVLGDNDMSPKDHKTEKH